jgi:LysM repeat protein/predicted esterase
MGRSILLLIFLFLLSGNAVADTHVVARGDTLLGIARHYGVSLKALCQANSISKDRKLSLGQKLTIPEVDKSQQSPVHTIKSGDTPIGIAQKYGIAVDRLFDANGLDRKKPLRVGQKLIIPKRKHPVEKPKSEEPAPEILPVVAAASELEPEPAPTPPEPDGMRSLPIAMGLSAYFYEPIGDGRLAMKPVFMYLHGRGGSPEADCRRWAKLVRRMGWLVCPMGPEDRGAGQRGWANDWVTGRDVAMSAIVALRKKYGRRVQLFGNTLIGFSEGAFVAMNIGVREARTFNRWLILGADSSYWDNVGLEELERHKERVRRVYLITGEQDQVEDEIESVKKSLRRVHVDVRAVAPKGLGHSLELEDKAAIYRTALLWLDRG